MTIEHVNFQQATIRGWGNIKSIYAGKVLIKGKLVFQLIEKKSYNHHPNVNLEYAARKASV